MTGGALALLMETGCAPGCHDPSAPSDAYTVRPPRSTARPRTTKGLKRWITAHAGGSNWIGRLYVANTIEWTGTEFRQRGCAPNFATGWWSMACCKHQMRTSRPLNAHLDKGGTLFVFTLCKIGKDKRQYLVSVARASEEDTFHSMRGYARFILDHGSARMIASRMNRSAKASAFGRVYGDCHADGHAWVGAPPIGHRHRQYQGHSAWKSDNRTGHRIICTREFIVWAEPAFRATSVIKRNHRNLNVDDLDRFLVAV
jgi:hypothetical protein